MKKNESLRIRAGVLALGMATATVLGGCSAGNGKGGQLKASGSISGWNDKWDGTYGTMTEDDKKQATTAAAAANEFNRNLYREIQKLRGREENTFASGYSAFAALSTLSCGMNESHDATGELLRGLCLAADDAVPTLDEVARMTALTGRSMENCKSNGLSIADSLWISDRMEVADAFQSIYAPRLNVMDAQVFQTDFGSQANVDEVNKWVSDATNGMIEKMKDKPDPDTIAEIYNAIYFDGKWETEFDAADTKQEPFYGTASESEVDMMHRVGEMGYREEKEFQVVSLPYKDNEFVMNIYLPNDRNVTMDQMMSDGTLSKEQVDRIFGVDGSGAAAERQREVILSLPKFTIEDDLNLCDPVKNCGINQIFEDAHMSGLTTQDIYVSDIIQKTKIEVDEKGTKAAAVTAIVMNESSSIEEPAPTPIFIADHPFFFTITHQDTGTVLFTGSINQLD